MHEALEAFLQAVFFELGADGVELRRFNPHSCQLFVLRCRSLDDEHVARSFNSRVVLAIPGPKQPKAGQWAAFMSLIFRLFDVGLGAGKKRTPHRPLCKLQMPNGCQCAAHRNACII